MEDEGKAMGANKTGGAAHKGGGRLEYGSDGHETLPSEKGHPSGKGWGTGNVHGQRTSRKGTTE